ncbi:L-threonylcarbamoyladenylate synthase [Patescibacteria group bacterium]
MNKDKHIYIQKTVEVLNQGGIIIYPTDTAFGIGCLLDKHESIDKLFKLRKRPINKAMPVLVSNQDMALEYFKDPSNIVRLLMKKYWPGALTIVSGCKKKVSSKILSNFGEIGLRMPNHKIVLEIISKCNIPLLGSSANFHGSPTPHKYSDLDENLVNQVDYVLPGECTYTKSSTVVRVVGEKLEIIRQGVIIIDI